MKRVHRSSSSSLLGRGIAAPAVRVSAAATVAGAVLWDFQPRACEERTWNQIRNLQPMSLM